MVTPACLGRRAAVTKADASAGRPVYENVERVRSRAREVEPTDIGLQGSRGDLDDRPLLKVATPLTAVTVSVPTSGAPPGLASPRERNRSVLSLVTTLLVDVADLVYGVGWLIAWLGGGFVGLAGRNAGLGTGLLSGCERLVARSGG